MDRTLKYLSYLSVGLNAFYILEWIYIFSTFQDHTSRINAFNSFFTFLGLSSLEINILLIILTIISIIIFAKGDSIIRKILIVIQTLFLLLYVWQYL